MKKLMLTAGIATALTCVTAPAAADSAADTKNALYIGVAMTDTFLDDDNVAIKVGYNRALFDAVPGLSVDAELTTSIFDEGGRDNTDVELLPNPDPTSPVLDELSYFSAGGFARYDYGLDQFVPGVGIYGRVGGVYTSIDYADSKDGSFDLAYGGGVNYSFTPKTSVFADYTATGGDVEFTEISIGIKASF